YALLRAMELPPVLPGAGRLLAYDQGHDRRR
ncbi:MAG: hypothetical protein QOI16_3444, partial [Pseudonocardiales bacterium]|nr:hypothetical protein [Pseudonocardiales bacterium]